MRVTGYCPCQKCRGKYSDGKTANGHRIGQGDTFVAADKRHAFGTKMIVPGYNDSQPVDVLDRGGAIRGNRLDIFFDSHRKARQWGVRYLLVKVGTREPNYSCLDQIAEDETLPIDPGSLAAC
jgi:3D (Asp-Asp-Asp) domain-containing protein